MSLELIRMSKKGVTRLFVSAIAAVAAGIALGATALTAAVASDAIDVGGSYGIELSGGAGAWTALGLVVAGSLVALAGTLLAVVAWVAALLNTWEVEDKAWFAGLLVLGLLGFGLIAMIAYVAAGPDGTNGRHPRVPAAATPSSQAVR